MARSSAQFNTPTQLQELGVPANLGTVMLDRGYMSWKDQQTKKYLLRVAWILPAAKAIPRPGDQAKRTDGASQLLLGLMLGQDRSTTNRDLALFCGEDADIVHLFNKWRPGIGCVNRYSERRPACDQCRATGKEQPDPQCKGCAKLMAQPPKEKILLQRDPAELAKRYGHELFDAEMEGVSGAGPVELWTYDENISKPIRCVCRKGQMKFNFSSNCMKCGGKGFTLDPERKMGPSPRNVLTVLQLKGIAGIRKEDGSYTPPYLDISCKKIGQLAGLCENTVSECLDEWEDLKVLQIVPGDVIRDSTGAVVFRFTQRIIWLPGLLLDHDIVRRERERFAALMADTLERANLNGWPGATTYLNRISALHNELLNRWTMSRHSLGAFWNAMRKLIYREGIPCGYKTRAGVGWEHDYREYLFPVHLKE